MNQVTTDLKEFGILRVSGDGAKKLLQGQLTCNVDEITPQHASLAAHCNPQGRIISLFYLFLYQDQYHMHMPRELIPIAQTALKKYAVFFKVELTDVSDELSQIGFCGNLDENPTCIKLPDNNPRYILINNTLANKDAKEISFEQWKALDIAAGIPAIYPETSEKFLPHEINLQNLNAISFNKGCYTGQEIIARMHYRGKLKTHMYRAKIHSNHPPTRGSALFDALGKEYGTIVDFALVGYNNYELLFVASEADINSTTLFLDPEKTVTLEIIL